MCCINCTSELQIGRFYMWKFPPRLIWYSYLKNSFLKIAKPHETEAILYREPLSNYQRTITPLMNCPSGFKKRIGLQ